MNTLRKLLGLILGLVIMQAAYPHYKASYHVIVDTDGGIDDFRALCMLLATPEIEVIAVTTVDGILTPEKTAQKVSTLLHLFGHQGIPVGVGSELPDKGELPAGASELAGRLGWGNQDGPGPAQLPGAVDLIRASVELEEMPVDIIALGPLTNVAQAIASEPGLQEEIRRIFWYSESRGREGFNHRVDPRASGLVENSGIGLDIISGNDMVIGDLQSYLHALDTVRSDYARAIRDFYMQDDGIVQAHQMGSRFADDCIPAYLTHPGYFTVDTLTLEPVRREARAHDASGLTRATLQILDTDREDRCIIFKSFPVDRNLFEEDVARIAGQVIEKYGRKEWKIVVLTNEFHEHLGIYSIVGAKMGLRAREYFNVGIDELIIESLAGSNPPVSCLNDGLQASTGSTLGHGTISVTGDAPVPEARFTFKNTTIRLKLKEDIRDQIRKDVSYGIRQFGLDSPEYWDYIRALALQYWLTLDRREIFEIIV